MSSSERWHDEDLARDTRRENPPAPAEVIEPVEEAEDHCDLCQDWFPRAEFEVCHACLVRYHTEDLHICPDQQEGSDGEGA